jgi:hypothetical protein
MTVVLKAGACCGTVGIGAWFDEVSLTEVIPEPTTVATGAVDPPSAGPVDFTIDWNSMNQPLGDYEATVTVYDAAFNESSITRSITLAAPDTPLIEAVPTTLTDSVSVGETPADAMFTVENSGIDTLNYTIQVDQPWLSLSSYSGSLFETDPPDAIGVYFDPMMTPGPQVAKITISDPNAWNNPVEVTVTIDVGTVLPDLDLDGDVDQGDYARLQTCYTEAAVQIEPDDPCVPADFNGDRYIDSIDQTIMSDCSAGANVIPDKTCDDDWE